MTKPTVAFLFTLITFSIFSQENRVFLYGKVIFMNNNIADAHIINNTTKVGTISDDDGLFEIPVKVGDTLTITHVNLNHKAIIISPKIISEKKIQVILSEKVYSLDEFTLEKPKSIFYVDPEIMPNTGPKVTAKTLNLPYANTVVKKDKTILKFRSGGIISLDNLINTINGNNRRRKLAQKLAKEDNELIKIRKLFTDDFFITDLKIKKENIIQFLNFCAKSNLISTFKKKNLLELTKLLIEESKNYPHKILNEDLFLTKKTISHK